MNFFYDIFSGIVGSIGVLTAKDLKLELVKAAQRDEISKLVSDDIPSAGPYIHPPFNIL